ncbi:MAG TPA: hypothetical protein DCF33_20375, partial [Saprospirales bacterium]|nr:hypothetical protein [Saprospirales bacterium]
QNGSYFTGSTANYYSTGIYLNNLASLPFPDNSVEIRENFFYPGPFQVPSLKLTDVYLDNSSHARVFNNFVESNEISLNLEGVRVQGGGNNLVDCNRVLGGENDQSVSYILDNSTSNLLIDNISSYTSHGLRFSGICNMESRVRFSSLYHNDFGIVYEEDGITGDQYFPASPNNPVKGTGNEWFSQDWEPAGGYIGARHQGLDFIVQLSRYKVPPPPTGNYGSSQHPFEYQMDQGVDPSIWFQEDALAYWDDYLCPEHPEAPSYPDGPYLQLDRKIAGGQTGLGEYTGEGYMALHESYLYEKAKENPGILSTDSLIAAFVSARENQPIGQLYAVKKTLRDLYQIPQPIQLQLDFLAGLCHARVEAVALIDSILLDTTLTAYNRWQWVVIRTGHLDTIAILQQQYAATALPAEQAFTTGLAGIVSANNAIAGTKTWEQNQKFVNQMLLERILAQVGPSSTELSLLHAIASSCPEQSGWAVYDARTYYAFLTDSIVPMANCMPVQERQSWQQATGTLHIWPNPASNQCQVSWENPGPMTRLRITDVLGNPVFDAPYANPISEINTTNFSSGIYLIQVLEQNRILATAKLVVAH